MKNRLLASLLSLALAAVPAVAQEGAMPKPGAEHQRLHAHIGTWDAAVDMVGMGASKGVSETKMGLGGFWRLETFKGEFGGMPFEGHGTTGYCPIKGKYIGTWMDNFSPSMMVLEGGFDASGKVLTMTGLGPNHEGKMVPHRMVTTAVDATSMRFEMFVAGADGKETKMMTITYTKRAGTGEAPKAQEKTAEKPAK